MKKIAIITCMMYVVGFSIDNQDEPQLCFQEVDDEYCQKLKTGIMLGAKFAASNADDIDVYLGMKKIGNDAKKMVCRKAKNPKKEMPEYFVFSEDLKNIVITYYDTNATVMINEVDGMIIMQAGGEKKLLTNPKQLQQLKNVFDKQMCAE